jgi:hypothetical protein
MKKYCDDGCEYFHDYECALGYEIEFKTPHSYTDIMEYNWGWHPVKSCEKIKVKNLSIKLTPKVIKEKLAEWKASQDVPNA